MSKGKAKVTKAPGNDKRPNGWHDSGGGLMEYILSGSVVARCPRKELREFKTRNAGVDPTEWS